MRKTPLYQKHVEFGGKIIDFGGWALPVQYTGIIFEHLQVRNAAGLFDVSHMGELKVTGPGATDFLQKVMTNDILTEQSNKVTYTPMCYPDGGTVDDLLIYKLADDEYLLVVNAVNKDKDLNWLKEKIKCSPPQDCRSGEVEVSDVSDNYAQLALQGPKAETILQKLTEYSLSELKFYRFEPEVNIGGKKAILSRTGYTGEDGFELYLSPEDAPVIWEELLTAGKDQGLVPAGLGARDTLRFESALPLYGRELSPDITPLEAGLDRFVKLDKEEFVGREALLRQKTKGVPRKLVGFEMTERGVPRSGYEVFIGEEKVGYVTSGNYAPGLKKNIGLALIKKEYAELHREMEINIRNRRLKAKIVEIPFYKKRYKKSQAPR